MLPSILSSGSAVKVVQKPHRVRSQPHRPVRLPRHCRPAVQVRADPLALFSHLRQRRENSLRLWSPRAVLREPERHELIRRSPRPRRRLPVPLHRWLVVRYLALLRLRQGSGSERRTGKGGAAAAHRGVTRVTWLVSQHLGDPACGRKGLCLSFSLTYSTGNRVRTASSIAQYGDATRDTVAVKKWDQSDSLKL